MDPGLFFASADKQQALAAEVCAGCPVAFDCREYGRDEPWGLYGGLPQGEPGRPKLADRHRVTRRAVSVNAR
jgi:hypothetical protein